MNPLQSHLSVASTKTFILRIIKLQKLLINQDLVIKANVVHNIYFPYVIVNDKANLFIKLFGLFQVSRLSQYRTISPS